MKFIVDDEVVFELNETQMKVLCSDIKSHELCDDLKRRVRYIIEHKYEQCFKRLKQDWEPKLKELGLDSIPLDNDKFAELVFSHPNYKNRTQREEEAQIKIEVV